jgi:hypothetical protein
VPAFLDANGAQMASSQRTRTTGAGPPGGTVSWRRTSR